MAIALFSSMEKPLQQNQSETSQSGHREGEEIMKSINFEFLRADWQQLASLAGFAEYYSHPDPVSSLIKMRTYLEQIVELVYDRFGFSRPYNPSLHELLNTPEFKRVIPTTVQTIMHAIRVNGNRAVHRNEGTTEKALQAIKDGFHLAQWVFLTFTQQDKSVLPAYRQPTPEDFGLTAKAELKRQKKSLLQKLEAQEAQMQQLLDELTRAREQAQAAQLSEQEMRAQIQAAQYSCSVLDFSEAQTRKYLIDVMLADAGWNVGAKGQNTTEVGQEVEIPHQSTPTGIGYADYVLYEDDGHTPLAVIEAKKTAKDVNEGRQQAKSYADGLEQQTGHRPMIFYTNGFDLWLWDDKQGYVPRQIWGFYSKDSIRFVLRQRTAAQNLQTVKLGKDIIDRDYQYEAVTQVLENFQNRRRKALIVQATGTGKTRVAIALSEALVRAGWVKRILFLCDRRELRKQAKDTFTRFLPNEPVVYISASTSLQTHHKVYLATYPAMMKCYTNFDPGFFDLIIADESHRSIYNRYRDLFFWYDSLQVGLTATPVSMIQRNTYDLFECPADNPTAHYDFEKAVTDGYLCPFEVKTFTTPFLREGIKYSQMTKEQREQLEAQETVPQDIEFEQGMVDKYIFNRDTNKLILKNLMDNGIRIKDGSQIGKTIIFARSHNHAILLQKLFDEMYPQYGGNFCRVIDNYDPRASELIDDFKGIGRNHDLTIAISVDMLDTGIDVPEIVNLVFAKPVYSYVKFWQMIGRGTRLCEKPFRPRPT